MANGTLANTAILVLGMHRSGTSAAAGVLSRLGVELGPELLPPQADNPKGFFEHQEIVKLHDELLSIFDSTWADPCPLPMGWERDPRIAQFRYRLADIIRRDFADCALWGVKDPRLSRLVPLWVPVLRELNIDAKAVLVVRHPNEVAASLRRRERMGSEQAVMLWLSHVLASERESRELPRGVVLYEDLLHDWGVEMRRLGDVLGVSFLAVPRGLAEKIEGFLDGDLRNHAGVVISALHAPQNAWAEAVFEAIVRWRREGISPEAVCDRAAEALAHAEAAAVPVAAYMRSQCRSVAHARAAESRRADLAEHHANEAETARDREAHLRSVAEGERDAAAARADEAARDLAGVQQDATEARCRAEQAGAEVIRIRAELARQKAAALAAAEEAMAECSLHVTEADQLRTKVADLTAELADAVAAREALLQSTTWKATKPIRAIGAHLPVGVRRGLRRGAALVWRAAKLKPSGRVR